MGMENSPLFVLAAAPFPAEEAEDLQDWAWTSPWEGGWCEGVWVRVPLRRGERAAPEVWGSVSGPGDGSPRLCFQWRLWCLHPLLYLAGDGWHWNRHSWAAWSQSAVVKREERSRDIERSNWWQSQCLALSQEGGDRLCHLTDWKMTRSRWCRYLAIIEDMQCTPLYRNIVQIYH